MPVASSRPSRWLRLLLAADRDLGCAALAAPSAERRQGDPRAAIAKRLDVGVERYGRACCPHLRGGARRRSAVRDERRQYALSGDLYATTTGHNSPSSAASRRARLRCAPYRTRAIIFTPRITLHRHVFTDVDCGYCRKLHSEIAEYNGSASASSTCPSRAPAGTERGTRPSRCGARPTGARR